MGGEKEPARAIVEAAVTAAVTAAPLGPRAALGAGVLAGGVEAVKLVSGSLLVEAFKNPDHWLAEEWERGRAAEIDQNREALVERVDRLLEVSSDSPDTVNNIIATFAVWSKARTQTADPKKARLLMAALVNSFDPDVYREGLTSSLLKLIASLDYGEIYLLKSINSAGGLDPVAAARFLNDSVSMELTLLHWHSERLLDAGLVHTSRYSDGSFDPKLMRRNRIGDKLLQLIGDDGFREAEALY